MHGRSEFEYEPWDLTAEGVDLADIASYLGHDPVSATPPMWNHTASPSRASLEPTRIAGEQYQSRAHISIEQAPLPSSQSFGTARHASPSAPDFTHLQALASWSDRNEGPWSMMNPRLPQEHSGLVDRQMRLEQWKENSLQLAGTIHERFGYPCDAVTTFEAEIDDMINSVSTMRVSGVSGRLGSQSPVSPLPIRELPQKDDMVSRSLNMASYIHAEAIAR